MTNINPSRSAWTRLKRNKGALAGLIVIILTLFVAIFAYSLAPDSSPYANRMIVEIGGRTPGYKMNFLLLPKQKKPESVSIFSRLINGKEDPYDYIPILGYEEGKDSLIISKFIDEGIGERMAYSIAELNNLSYDNIKWKVKSITFRLGTDKNGRDILSRLLIGTRVSLSVGLITVLISLSIGVILGSVAGYFGGKTDDTIMWLINVIWSIPTLLLVFAITLLMGKGFWQVFIAIGLTMWVSVARLIRGQVLSIREMEYIEAARALGYSSARIIFRHVLPNVVGPVLVLAASNFASAIVIEAGLSFLGVGVQPPQPSWGLMIRENYNFIITQNPMLALVPGFAIMILVLAFNMLGNGLRDAVAVRD